MKGSPTTFWGKLKRDENDAVIAWHPLIDHSADVAACCRALLDRTIVRRRLAHLGGLDDLAPVHVARLSVLAALHDAGKFNLGFQNKAFPQEHMTGGHVTPLVALFDDASRDATQRLLASLPIEEILTWAAGDSEPALRLLIAAICHHGRPAVVGEGHKARFWQPARGLDPFEGIRGLVARVRIWFPEAFTSDGAALPDAPEFQHGFSGLVTLADWIGSDDVHFFPYTDDADAGSDRMDFARAAAVNALNQIGIDPASARSRLGAAKPSFAAISDLTPRDLQQKTLDLPANDAGSISTLEAETGSGKTEAALARFIRLFHAGEVDGIYFALPTRTAATQMHTRVLEAVKRAFPEESSRPPVTLAVPGYIRVDDRDARPLPCFEVLWPDDDKDRSRYRGWAAENPKRYLAGSVVVGTIDQVLLSTVTVNHAHLRATSLLRLLLVIDEVHASDAYMIALTRAVLANHLRAGGHAFLMSATLGSGARRDLLTADRKIGAPRDALSLGDAREVPYPLLTHRVLDADPVRVELANGLPSRKIHRRLEPWIDDDDRIAHAALEAAARGARVIIIRNTVSGCVSTQLALEALAAPNRMELLFTCAGVPAPHHSRYAREDRRALDTELEHRFGKDSPRDSGCVVVATQTIQQSLDLDADLMLTDLCPMDVMLQRLGRLYRHERPRPPGYEEPLAIIMIPSERDLSPLIRKNGKAPGPHGLGTVYDDLRIIEATWRALEEHDVLAIPEMNRRLVEDTTHPEVLSKVMDPANERWQQHVIHLLGEQIAQNQLGELNLLPRTKVFGTFKFPEHSTDIQTRLGDDDRLVEFTEPPTGPFTERVYRLTIPSWLAKGVSQDATPSEIAATPGERGITFNFGSRSFIYDRLGLRPAEALPDNEEDLADA